MIINEVYADEFYEVLERADWPTDRIVTPAEGDPAPTGTLVRLNSPSGDEVVMDLHDDAILLRDASGNITATAPTVVAGTQFEETTLDEMPAPEETPNG